MAKQCGETELLDCGYTYQGNRRLSLPASGASIDHIDPINDIDKVADDLFDLDHNILLQGAQVIGISNLEFIYNCLQYKRYCEIQTSALPTMPNRAKVQHEEADL